MIDIPQLRGHTNVQRGLPIVTPSAAAPFQHFIVRATVAVAVLQPDAAAPAQAGTAGKRLGIPILARLAKVYMLKLALGIHLDQVGKAAVFQVKQIVLASNHTTSLLFLYCNGFRGKVNKFSVTNGFVCAMISITILDKRGGTYGA